MRRLAAAAALAAGLAAAEPADRPMLHPLFGDGMVFPRDRAAPVWGWTTPGARVRVGLAGAAAEAVAGADGRWEARLGPVPAGGPFELTVDGPTPVVRHAVMVGEVWLFAGQSNMEMGLRRAAGGTEEAAGAAAATGLRLLNLGRRLAGTPQDLPPGAAPAWRQPDPAVAGGFPAVAWFTGRRLQQRLGVPVGLVATAWSGSNIRGWMPEEALAGLGLYADERAALAAMNAVAASGGPDVPAQDRAAVAAWWQAHDPGTAAGWHQAGATDGPAWSDQAVPGTWADDGVSWLVCTVELPAAAAGRSGRLVLGGIEDEDVAWVNGREVGGVRGTDARSYPIPGKVLVAGANRIAVRAWAEGRHGRIRPVDGGCRIEWESAPAPAALPVTWRRTATAGPAPVRPRVRFSGGNGSSTMLWNGAIRPLTPFAFAGVVWYQGEQDAGSPDYRRLLPAMIGAWRGAFAQPGLPFVLVGLPAFHAAVDAPVQDRLTFGRVRDDQLAAARTLPAVGVAVTTDLGDAVDVHPLRKREVGERVAAAAQAAAYGAPGGGGPLFVRAVAAGAAMRVEFDHVSGGGLEVRPGSPSGFALAGADGVWRHAVAALDGVSVVVTSGEVAVPVAVRYGWADNPPVTLYDRAGFPAAPFRSDAP